MAVQKEEELIPFRLKNLEKVIVAVFCIGGFLFIGLYYIPFLATFEGVWIMGLPRSVFVAFLTGVLNMITGIVCYVLYSKYILKEVSKR